MVFVAGGVGINPLISMVTFLAREKESRGILGFEVVFLYSTRDPTGAEGLQDILFLRRLQDVSRAIGQEGEFTLFLTSGKEAGEAGEVKVEGFHNLQRRRIQERDLMGALGPVKERGSTVCYICGVPGMTDDFVERVRRVDGMKEENVLFEKWW